MRRDTASINVSEIVGEIRDGLSIKDKLFQTSLIGRYPKTASWVWLLTKSPLLFNRELVINDWIEIPPNEVIEKKSIISRKFAITIPS